MHRLSVSRRLEDGSLLLSPKTKGRLVYALCLTVNHGAQVLAIPEHVTLAMRQVRTGG